MRLCKPVNIGLHRLRLKKPTRLRGDLNNTSSTHNSYHFPIITACTIKSYHSQSPWADTHNHMPLLLNLITKVTLQALFIKFNKLTHNDTLTLTNILTSIKTLAPKLWDHAQCELQKLINNLSECTETTCFA